MARRKSGKTRIRRITYKISFARGCPDAEARTG